VLACRVIELDDWCQECGAQGVPRDTVLRQLAHVPLGWRPTMLQVRVRRYRCTGCGHVWPQDTTAAAAPRAKLSRPAVLWAVKSVVIDRLSIARVAAGLGASWHTVNDAVLAAGRRLLIDDPARLNGVRVIGVDEHCWRHTRRGDKFVTVIIDLTPVRDGTGPAHPTRTGRMTAAALDLVHHRVALANQLRAHLRNVLPGAVGLFAEIDSGNQPGIPSPLRHPGPRRLAHPDPPGQMAVLRRRLRPH